MALSAVVAGAVTQPAAAAPPKTGSAALSRTTDTAWIGVEASRLSGRNLAVACARTQGEWAATVTDVGLVTADAAEYYGLSVVASGGMHLSPYVCEGLRLGHVPSSRQGNELQVAWAVDVLLHESTHMGLFTFDEAVAEACARAELPAELNRLYGIAYASPEMRRLTLAATWFRRTQGAAYQGGSCDAAAQAVLMKARPGGFASPGS
jgi:hypothetical protein